MLNEWVVLVVGGKRNNVKLLLHHLAIVSYSGLRGLGEARARI